LSLFSGAKILAMAKGIILIEIRGLISVKIFKHLFTPMQNAKHYKIVIFEKSTLVVSVEIEDTSLAYHA
jgi:hypothetical protein